MALSPQQPSSLRPLPAWVRTIDLICLGLLILAAIVAMFGGFRERIGGVRLALTSPYRLLIWAAVLGVGRHIAWPQQPIYRHLPQRIAAAAATPAFRTAAGAVLGTRLPILFVGYLAVFMIGYREGGAPWRLFANELDNLQVRWDTGWYLDIARNGYQYERRRPTDQQNIVFFPAYPMLVRAGGRLLGGSDTAAVLAGTLISIFAFVAAAAYLFRIARDLLGDDDQARYAVWLLATFPFAVFFGAIYTESLYLLGATGAFHHLRRGEYLRAGLWGLLVGLTRPNGCFLAVPLGLLAISPLLPSWLRSGREPFRDGTLRPTAADAPGFGAPAYPHGPRARLIRAVAAAAMPGVGVLIYCAYLWRMTGDPLAWAAGHIAWGREYQGLSVLVVQRFEWLANGGVYEYTSTLPADLLNVLGAAFVLSLTWPVARTLGLAYAVFILVNMLPPLAAGGFLSAGRFASVMFPAFVWLASAIHPVHRPAWLSAFMAVQALNAALFYTWRDLY